MVTISAIVPTYNRAAFLAEALMSIQAQTRPVSEIIVWNDGSSDATEHVVRDASARPGPEIRYFYAENAGKSCALNRAIAESKGDAIWICDDDDLCRPDAAARMVATMEATGAPVVCGGYLRFGTDPETGRRVAADPGYWPDLTSGSLLRHLLEDIFLFQNATLVMRTAYQQVGPFREDLARAIDYDMIIRLAARFPVAYVDAVLFDQRKHDGERGAAGARHKAIRMDAVWGDADRTVFQSFRTILPMSLYQAMFASKDQRLIARAAHLQRGAVYARRGLWPMALDDFEAAAAQAPDLDLSAAERLICLRAMAGKHGCDGVVQPSHAARIVALRDKGDAGAVIAAAIGRGLRWRCREALTKGRVLMLARFALLYARMSLGAGGRRARLRPAEDVTERSMLPKAAYQW